MFRRDAAASSSPQPGLTLSVTPTKSAWYPGETFRARITFSNPVKTRTGQPRSVSQRVGRTSVDVLRVPTALGSPVTPSEHPSNVQPKERRKRRERLHLIGIDRAEGGAREESEGSSSPNGIANDPEWRKQNPRSRSRSAEGVEEDSVMKEEVNSSSKPGLEGRTTRTVPSSIPTSHSHSRKISLTQSNGYDYSSSIISPTASDFASPQPRLSQSVSESSLAGTNANLGKTGNLVSISEDEVSGSTQTADDNAQERVSVVSPETYDGYSPGAAPRIKPGHSRMPSYMKGYSSGPSTAARTSFEVDVASNGLPGRRGSQSHSTEKLEHATRSTTIIWAHARLRGRFTPSTTYIPPDPLLPLRTTLLHQPLGSGGFSTTSQIPPSSSGWITFGSGTIGNEQAPSLTGSLVGLAKGLVNTGIGVGPQAGGGTLEEQRKRIWNSKDLPVLETMRTLIDVNEELREGETASYNYEITLPDRIPPTFRGRALRFTYEVCISVNIGLDASGKQQRSEDFLVPVKIMAMPLKGSPYDILNPIILKSDTGTVTKVEAAASPHRIDSIQPDEQHETDFADERVDSLDKLKAWARTLLMSTDASPDERSRNGVSSVTPEPELVRADSGSPGIMSPTLGMTSNLASAIETRATSKTFFEIFRQGQQVAIIHLSRSAVSVGEAVSGVVQLNRSNWPLHVCKFSATLMTDERIPYHLLPPSASSSEPVHPTLRKIVAEYHSSLVIDTVELAFELNVAADGTPGFFVAASSSDDAQHTGHAQVAHIKSGSSKPRGQDTHALGGLRWLIQFRFGVLPSRDKPSLMPSDLGGVDRDNMYQAAPVSLSVGEAEQTLGSAYEASGGPGLDMVRCEVPVTILPGKLRGHGAASMFSI